MIGLLLAALLALTEGTMAGFHRAGCCRPCGGQICPPDPGTNFTNLPIPPAPSHPYAPCSQGIGVRTFVCPGECPVNLTWDININYQLSDQFGLHSRLQWAAAGSAQMPLATECHHSPPQVFFPSAIASGIITNPSSASLRAVISPLTYYTFTQFRYLVSLVTLRGVPATGFNTPDLFLSFRLWGLGTIPQNPIPFWHEIGGGSVASKYGDARAFAAVPNFFWTGGHDGRVTGSAIGGSPLPIAMDTKNFTFPVAVGPNRLRASVSGVFQCPTAARGIELIGAAGARGCGCKQTSNTIMEI